MDNFRFDVTWQGEKAFRLLLETAMNDYKATHYYVNENKALVFCWHENSDKPPLPYEMATTAVVDFAWNWLAVQDYGRQPDHDGDNTKGWRIYNEAWGHVDSNHYAFIAIQPVWAMHGK